MLSNSPSSHSKINGYMNRLFLVYSYIIQKVSKIHPIHPAETSVISSKTSISAISVWNYDMGVNGQFCLLLGRARLHWNLPSLLICSAFQHYKSVADLRGGVRDARPPLCVQILSISCSFWENLAKLRVHAPPLEGSRPPLGEILDPSLQMVKTPFLLKNRSISETSLSVLVIFQHSVAPPCVRIVWLLFKSPNAS